MSQGAAGQLWKPSPGMDYLVNKIGSRYEALGGRKHHDIYYPDLDDVWNDIVASGYAKTEWGAGEFTVPATLGIHMNDTVIKGQGEGATYLKQAGGNTNVDMIEMSDVLDDHYNNLLIRDLTIDGNRDNNTAGRGIKMDCATTTASTVPYAYWFHLENVAIRECDEEAIYANNPSPGNKSIAVARNLRIEENDGGTTYAQDVWFNRLFDMHLECFRSSRIRFTNCSAGSIEGLYCGVGGTTTPCMVIDGGVADGAAGMSFTDSRFDNTAGIAVRILDNTRRTRFNGCYFTNYDQDDGSPTDDDTYAALSVEDTSKGIIVNDCYFGFENVKNEMRPKYGIHEIDTTSENHYKNNTFGYGEILSSGNDYHMATAEMNLLAGNGSVGINNTVGGRLPRLIRT